jgi:N-glycosidase YbiA
MAIKFYRTTEEYGCFSNFSRHAITIGGQIYKTSEHFFQAQKFTTTDKEWAEAIVLAETPSKCASMGRDREHILRPDWENIKDDVMRLALINKFIQNQNCKEKLLSTGDQYLIEDTSEDYYWGCGTIGSGRNKLGLILMEVRLAIKMGCELQYVTMACNSIRQNSAQNTTETP